MAQRTPSIDFRKYRWALFTVGPETNAALQNLANDAMTWDSLIHTTYFDQPEIADIVGDHISREARSEDARVKASTYDAPIVIAFKQIWKWTWRGTVGLVLLVLAYIVLLLLLVNIL